MEMPCEPFYVCDKQWSDSADVDEQVAARTKASIFVVLGTTIRSAHLDGHASPYFSTLEKEIHPTCHLETHGVYRSALRRRLLRLSIAQPRGCQPGMSDFKKEDSAADRIGVTGHPATLVAFPGPA
jgi:hypothetical protein